MEGKSFLIRIVLCFLSAFGQRLLTGVGESF